MNKISEAIVNFKDGFNCAQSVFSAFSKDILPNEELAYKIASGFGAGIGRQGEVCGVVTGSVMAIGLRFGTNNLADSAKKEVNYQIVNEFIAEFKNRNSYIDCSSLLNIEMKDTEARKKATENGLFQNRCPVFVKDASEILEMLINKYEKGNSKGYFDDVAVKWNDLRENFFSENVRQKAYSYTNLTKDTIVADIGAGSGFMTEGLVGKGLSVIAVDQSELMLQEMHKRLKDTGLKIYYRVGEAHQLPIERDSVDYVFANMYLHHVNNPLESILEMQRILKNGGKLIITDLDEHTYEFLRIEQYDRWMGFKRADIKEWFSKAEFKNIIVDCIGENCCSTSHSTEQKAKISIFVAVGEK
jgi:C_GCAxxG_C_C family probable redox protein